MSTMTPERHQQLADALWPSMRPQPNGPAVDADGWVQLEGGGWRKLPEHLRPKAKPDPQPGLWKGWK